MHHRHTEKGDRQDWEVGHKPEFFPTHPNEYLESIKRSLMESFRQQSEQGFGGMKFNAFLRNEP